MIGLSIHLVTFKANNGSNNLFNCKSKQMRYLNNFIIIFFLSAVLNNLSSQTYSGDRYVDTIKTLVFQDTSQKVRLISYCKCDWEYIDSNMIVPNIQKYIHFEIRRISENILKDMTNFSIKDFRRFYHDFLDYYNTKLQKLSKQNVEKCFPFYYEVISKYELINLVDKVKDLPDKDIYNSYKNIRTNFIKSWKSKNYIFLYEPEFAGAKEIYAPNNYGLSVSYAPIIRKQLMEELKMHKWNDKSNPDYELQDQYLRDQSYFLTNNPTPEIQGDIAKNINNWASSGLPLIFQMFPKIDNELLIKKLTYEILYNTGLKGLMFKTWGDEWNVLAMENLSKQTTKPDLVINILKDELKIAKSEKEKINVLKHFWQFPTDENVIFLLNYDRSLKKEPCDIKRKIQEVLLFYFRTKQVSVDTQEKISSYYQTDIK